MKVISRTPAGQEKEWKNSQPILKYEFKLPIGAQVPDIIAEDFTLKLSAGIPNVDCEKERFMYYVDVVEDGKPIPFAMKAAQTRILPSM